MFSFYLNFVVFCLGHLCFSQLYQSQADEELPLENEENQFGSFKKKNNQNVVLTFKFTQEKNDSESGRHMF